MAEKSNLYIEKVYSEHPTSVWAFDEPLDYISLINEAGRKMWLSSKWDLTACSAVEDASDKNTPFRDSAFSKISCDVPAVDGDVSILESVYSINTNKVNDNLGNITFSMYVNMQSIYVQKIEYGYKYYDSSISAYIYVLKELIISLTDFNKWKLISATLDAPPSYGSDIHLVMKVYSNTGGTLTDYNILINGLSFGQWAENFGSESLGVEPYAIPAEIPLPSTLKVLPAYQYSSLSNCGYYISNDNTLFAKNFGIPMVYGSSGTTKIYTNLIDTTYYPSLIVPGNGFLNELGKYLEYTAEMWISIDTDSPDPFKIFGPITGTDGLYVEDGFLTLVIDGYFGSHYIGEWNRPMLVHIRYSSSQASVLINGEQVISFSINTEMSFPNDVDESGKSLDWLGFYSSENIGTISIDSFAMYSYFVPSEVAKRRFVWGQAVIAPETINAGLNATTAYNDFSFIKNGVNYSYPDLGKWSDAYFSNLAPSSKSIGIPQYDCPEQYFGNFTKDDLCSALQILESAEDQKYFTFRPNPSWDNQQCYLLFNNMGIINEKIDLFYIIFETSGTVNNEPLIKILNKTTNDYILISVQNLHIKYTTNIGGVVEEIQNTSISANTKYSAGIHIPTLINLGIDGLDRFFATQDTLAVYIGGDSETTFTGKFYRVGFDSAYNSRRFSGFYNQSGVIVATNASQMLQLTSNYTLIPVEKYGKFFPDIASSGYWQDHMPLSYFGKYVNDYDGNKNYELDTIQINLDYPVPLERNSIELTHTLTYLDLFTDYQLNDRKYAYLDNNIYTGYEDYQDLSQDSIKSIFYNTSRSHVRAYISFQKNTSTNFKTLADYTDFAVPDTYGFISPPDFVDWTTLTFEVIDGTVIKIPKTLNGKSVDFNDYSIVLHLDFNTEGTTHHPITFKSLELSSTVLERTRFTAMGTKYGIDVYPYIRRGLYFSLKEFNPVQVYKGSTPHLYLTGNSGWRLRGHFGDTFERGISIPVNSQKGLDFKISAVQMWVKYSEADMPTEEIKVASIDFKEGIYDIFMISDSSGLRGKLLARDRSTGALLNNIEYYINGVKSYEPHIIKNEWSSVTFVFPNLITFNKYSGTINLIGPLTYNNISYYNASSLQIEQNTITNKWSTVRDSTWLSFTDSSWYDVYVYSTVESVVVDGNEIYSKYLGTDRVIIDDGYNGMLLEPDTIKVYTDVSWKQSVQTPV